MQQEDAFITTENSLLSGTILSFAAPNAPLFLSTYASNVVVGAVLKQIVYNTLTRYWFLQQEAQRSREKLQYV